MLVWLGYECVDVGVPGVSILFGSNIRCTNLHGQHVMFPAFTASALGRIPKQILRRQGLSLLTLHLPKVQILINRKTMLTYIINLIILLLSRCQINNN